MSTFNPFTVTPAEGEAGAPHDVTNTPPIDAVRPSLATTPEFSSIPPAPIQIPAELQSEPGTDPSDHRSAPLAEDVSGEPAAPVLEVDAKAVAKAEAQAAKDKLGPTGRPKVSFPEPAPLATHGPARILAICNQKGGVGKTTTSINFGAALASYGRRVLLVDLDPQGALSVGLGVKPSGLDVTIKDLLLDTTIPTREALLKTTVPGMDLLPADIDLAAAEVALVSEVGRENFVATALAQVSDDYDFILIDCQPSLGLLTINALAAAHGVLIPLECEFFALRGVDLLLDTMRKVVARINPQLQIEGLLPTMFDARTLHTREVVSVLVEKYGDAVFHTAIKRTIKFPDASVAGEPITTFAPSSSGANDYRDLAKEVLAR